MSPAIAGHLTRLRDSGPGQGHDNNAAEFWQFPLSTQRQQQPGSLQETLQTRSLESGLGERGMHTCCFKSGTH